MGSEDDTYEENDDFGSVDDYDYDYDDSAGESEEEEPLLDDYNSLVPSKPDYTILKESDIRQLQDDDIARLSQLLSIPQISSSLLLRHFNWSLDKVEDAWFDDEFGVRRMVGLVDDPVVQLANNYGGEVMCAICFDMYRCNGMHSVGCGHLYCDVCWRCYVSTSINDGPGCLKLRCPDPSCKAAVGDDMASALAATDEERNKYWGYLLRSYVEYSSKIKWCSAPGCQYAVEFNKAGSANYDVTCLCSNMFCWNCNEEAHRPVDCETVRKWILKNSGESDNVTWVLAYTKPCPKCKQPIEKNSGCMHMTCIAHCKHEFCWLCLSTWKDYRHKCNQYKKDEDESESKRNMAREYLERYAHYYERWRANEVSRVKALNDLHKMEIEQMEELAGLHSTNVVQLKFITDAWQQIVECRRVLKWTYAYGYYLPEKEDGKRELFEYLQGEAESGLERLHKHAEDEVQKILFTPRDNTGKSFCEFRIKLIDLTIATRTYFENLVRALQNGLSDV